MPDVFGLYLILTNPVVGYAQAAEAAVKEQVRYLQLRIKGQPRQQVLPVAHQLRRITSGSSTRLIINDDVVVARDVDADGVHLGQGDMSVDEARKIWATPGKLFGLSTHDEQQELRARTVAPDYVGVGPLYATPTKDKPDPVLGLERAQRIIAGSPLTTVAIGGIDATRLPELLASGIRNFAVVRAVNLSSDPRRAISELCSQYRE